MMTTSIRTRTTAAALSGTLLMCLACAAPAHAAEPAAAPSQAPAASNGAPAASEEAPAASNGETAASNGETAASSKEEAGAGQPASENTAGKPTAKANTGPTAEVFIPTEEISEDFAVPFPVDI